MAPMATLFLIVFINLLGFGIIIPILPLYALRLGAGPEVVSIVIGLYSLMQFLTSPLIGKLSDRHGRRPILIWSLALSAVSYVMLAVADNMTMLVASRIVGGAVAGNLATAFAYVTDISTPETRAKSMGMLGASFGMGFVFGPALGGLLAGNDMATADFATPALVAAALTVIAMVGVITKLPESLSPELRAKAAAQPKVSVAQQFHVVAQRRVLMALSGLGLIAMVIWSLLEATFSMWANDVLHQGPRDIGTLFAVIGVLSAAVQGGAMGPLSKRYGERALAAVTVVTYGLGFAWLATVTTTGAMYAAMSVLALGNALFNPSMSSLVSKEAAAHERGAVLGVYQSMGSLGRIIGPGIAGFIYAGFGPPAPYVLSALLAIPAAILLALSVAQKITPSVTPTPAE
ncbi:MAG: MFS transporter [Alphaproteobacteria bacterium]|nr:MFS transporter [Alphaproteobacteria bacterium]